MNEDFKVFEIPLDHIRVDPTQPRKHFDEQSLRELADSIKEQGLLQPIMVKANSDGTYLIIHGERRFKAHQIANMATIKCLIVDKDPSQIQDARVVENLVREDLSDMELAKEFQRRVDNGETHEQIAKAIKKSRAFVSQRLALMRLPEERKNQLEQGKISFADARGLLAAGNAQNSEPEPQHCYAVTMESLDVPKTLKQVPAGVIDHSTLKLLHEAYRKDLTTIRKALQ